MAQQPETAFKMKVQEKLKQFPDIWVFKTQQLSLMGVPDLIGCYKRRFFAWELKKDAKSPPTALQSHVLRSISNAGGLARVVNPDNLEVCLNELREIGKIRKSD